ncbi:vestitone reductase [Dorcoceras hygrometricum]|uniref:Dihydroflavonol 4-reductase n=1 Tax=Dorcoceras hygrometricum TaxID=472368 RepID=A0A2Z7CJR3_9LAMI|nr:vestitone reductase [Dorcoceras hygrometricum]
MGEEIKKGRICVTGATGFIGSWTVKRLLEDGYSVNATIRMDPEKKRDISYLTNLPGASERLNIYNADLDNPETFAAALEGCTGIFHMAHPLDFEEKEPEETKITRVVNGVRAILQACLDSKTVKRVVYTSSISAVAFNKNGASIIDESSWTDVDFVRSVKAFGGPYLVTKTLAERAAQQFAEEKSLDLVILNPTWVTGPFICPRIPDTVDISMALIFGNTSYYPLIMDSTLVHVDDVAGAHIHLFEYPEAKGRYICSAVEFTIDQLSQFTSARYPQFQMPTPDSWEDVQPFKLSGLSSKKLLETGFKYQNGLEEMFDGAIESCKQKGLL